MKRIAIVVVLIAIGSAAGFLVVRGRGSKPATMPPTSGSAQPATTTTTTATATATVIAPSPAAVAAAALADGTRELMRKLAGAPRPAEPQLDALLDATIASAGSLARDRSWAPAAVVAKVGKDRNLLFRWVRDNTALVPYAGSLRGAVGVMMDRVGNSLDRSLLLASLLRSSDLEVRLARGSLDPTAAGALTATWFKRKRPEVPTTTIEPPVVARLAEALERASLPSVLARSAQDDASAAKVASLVRAQVTAQTATLGKLVPAAPAPETHVGLNDHWWVQVQEGEIWTDLDTTQDAPGTAAAPATETFAADGIPDDLRHTLVLRVIGEIWRDGARQEIVLVEHALAPAAFVGQRIAITTVPIAMPTVDAKRPSLSPAEMRKALVDQTEWIPMITVGGTPVVHLSVTDGGDTFDMLDAHGNASRLARNLQKATATNVGGATDLLGSLPAGDEPPAAARPRRAKHSGFTAQWIEYEIRTPGLAPRVVRRPVFDAFGHPSDRSKLTPRELSDAARLDRGYALTGETEIAPMHAQVPEAFYADRIASALLRAKPVLRGVAKQGAAFPMEDVQRARLEPLPGSLEALGLARFRWSPHATSVFIDQLNVLTARRRLAEVNGQPRARHVFDIVTNGVGVWPSGGEDPRLVRMSQGITDTLSESLLAPCAKGKGACVRGPNTSDAFVASAAWSVVTDASAAHLASLSPDARAVAEADLQAGYRLVMSAKHGTWWRVQASTGETLGQGATGGTAQTETAILQLMVTTVSGGFCFAAVAYGGSSGAHLVGCVIGAMLGGVGGLVGLGPAHARFIGYALTLLGAVASGFAGMPDEFYE